MACKRCEERREAIKQAARERTVASVVASSSFVVRTLAEDIENAGRRLVRTGFQRRR